MAAIDRTTGQTSLETVDLDGLGIQLEAFLLVGEKVLNIFALITLELDHLSHLGVCDNGAIAGCEVLVSAQL